MEWNDIQDKLPALCVAVSRWQDIRHSVESRMMEKLSSGGGGGGDSPALL